MEPSDMCHLVGYTEYILTLFFQIEMEQYHCFKNSLVLLVLT